MTSHIPSVAWRRKCCHHSIGSSAGSFRRLCITSIRSNEQVPARSARTQNTTEELARLFDQDDQSPRQDVRKMNNSLPNAPFRRRPQTSLRDHTKPQNQSGRHNIFKYVNVPRKPAQAQPSSEAQSYPQTQQPNHSVPGRVYNARGLSPEPKAYSKAQLPPETQQTKSAPTQSSNSHGLPIDAKPSEAQPPPQVQRTNGPRIVFQDSSPRESYQTTSQRSSTRPSRPLPAGAIDLRNLGASQGPNGPTRRLPPRQANPARSPGAASGMRRPGIADAARQKLPTYPRGRARTATSPQRPNTFGSREKDNRISLVEARFEREKEEARKPKEVTYVPAAVSLETLSGTGPVLPAIGLGAWGQEEAVAHWVEGMLASSRSVWRSGGIRVDHVEALRDANPDDDTQGSEKKNTRQKDAEVKAGSEHEGQEAEELLKKEFEARKIAEKLFKGEYVFDGKDEKGVLGGLKRQAVRNGTYIPKDWERLAQKVGSLLPAEQVRRGGKRARV